MVMELLKAYPKDISLVIEVPLKEVEYFLNYMDRAVVTFDSKNEPEFQKTVDVANEFIKSLGLMCDSVRNYPDA
jgi:hypothetical protein